MTPRRHGRLAWSRVNPMNNQQLNSTVDSTVTPRNPERACAAGECAPSGAALPPYSPRQSVSETTPRSGHIPVGDRGERGVRKRRPSSRQKAEFLRDEGRNKTGFLGVKWVERYNHFQAYIRDHKRAAGAKVYCGSARTAEEAARLYDAKAREIYGRSAVTNFPTPRRTPRSTPRSPAPGVESPVDNPAVRVPYQNGTVRTVSP
jgi:hypothetical protein